jgi:long-chain acyl-CoA synthetase
MADSAVKAVQADIEREIAGRTLCDLMANTVREHRLKSALNWKEGDAWRSLSWGEYYDRAQDVTLGLRALGIGRGDFVAIMASNRPEHVIADAGIFHAAATPVSLYNTLAPEQIEYIANHCEAKVAVLENRDFMKRWEEIRSKLSNLQHVVMIEDAEDFRHLGNVLSWEELLAKGREERATPGAFEETWREIQSDDIATLIYTSGTTGPPKAVALTHRNLLYQLAVLERMDVIPSRPVAVSYLPLAHIAERMFSHYLGMYYGASVYFCPETSQLLEYVQQARPTAFLAVPRVWEKMQAGLTAKINAEENERKRKIALKALDTGKEVVRRQRLGTPIPIRVRLQNLLFDRLVFSKIRHGVGMDRCNLAITAAAPISEDVLEFFLSIGLPLYEVYGLSETTGMTHGNRPGARKIGTVGQGEPGQEYKLAEDGEVLVRGGNIMREYYKNPEATAETIDAEGWLHTGDLGKVDHEGFLSIVGRKKELIITAGGKNVSPNNIEMLLKEHPLIGQASVVGDRKAYLVALIVLDHETAPAWAAKEGVPFDDIASFSEHPRVQAEIESAVDRANARLANAEQVKKFRILPTEWTAESEELTPTLKLKRNVVQEKYAEEIEGLYAG